MNRNFLMILMLVTGMCLLSTVSSGQVKSGEEINWQVVSAGGTAGLSTDFILNGTVGQTAIGTDSSTSFIVFPGYWQKTYGDPCCDTPGDANNNGVLNILDVTFLLNYLYKGGTTPPCMAEADANGDGKINLLDVIRVIWLLYKMGPPPICGPDPWP